MSRFLILIICIKIFSYQESNKYESNTADFIRQTCLKVYSSRHTILYWTWIQVYYPLVSKYICSTIMYNVKNGI